MNKICTSIEQSRKLIELGIDVNTADMWYQYIGDSFKDGITKPLYFPMVMRDDPTEKDIPSWSLSTLLGLMPNFNMFKRTIECKIETTNHLIDKACDPIDAAFEMVCWLLENKKI